MKVMFRYKYLIEMRIKSYVADYLFVLSVCKYSIQPPIIICDTITTQEVHKKRNELQFSPAEIWLPYF